MWFKRKPKNRRLGREYVLDVKLRSSQVRAARTRMAAIAIGVVFATVLGLYMLWRSGEWALNRLVYENEAFALQEIDIQTDGSIPANELRRWTGVKVRQNLLALDLAKVKRDLELVSVIQSASVERILPHTLRVRVVEREPIAQINLPRPKPNGGIELAVWQIDAEGYVIQPLEARLHATAAAQPPEQLPVLSGLSPNDVQAGRRIDAPQVQAALQWLQAFDRSAMAGLVDVKRLDVSAPEVLLVTTGQGSEVAFGLTEPEQQLRRWQVVYEQGQKMSKAIASLDLAITNNIPVHWLEASAVPQVSPKRVKPKKHV